MPVPEMTCRTCGNDKEPTRVKSTLCRKCDGAAKNKAPREQKTAHRRLTLDLPVDVWDRLDAEAQANGMRIAGYLRNLAVKRDAKRHGAKS